MSALEISLLLFIVIREGFNMVHTQKLINKLMSRNYYDFKVSDGVGTIKKESKNGVVSVPLDTVELGPLHEFM